MIRSVSTCCYCLVAVTGDGYSNCLSMFQLAQHEPLCLAPHWACGLVEDMSCCDAARSVMWQVMPYSYVLNHNGQRSSS